MSETNTTNFLRGISHPDREELMGKQKPSLLIADFFDKMAENRDGVIADNIIVEYEQVRRSEGVISFLKPEAAELILDIGCGNARDFVPMLAKGSRVIGVDISPQMIEAARHALERCALGEYELRVGDATHLDFPDAYFDKVIASEVIEHIPDWKKSLSEMHRVLKRNGELVLSTPNRRSWYGVDRYFIEKVLRKQWAHPHDSWKTYRELEQVLRECGYTVLAKRGICYMPGFIIPYFVLPRFLKKVLISLVRPLENMLGALLPTHGYMICIKATKS